MAPAFAPFLAARRARERARLADLERERIELYARTLLAARTLAAEHGATEIVLFGSLALGTLDEGSDVDLAVRGVPPATRFFAAARAAEIVGRDVDLVDLDRVRPSLAACILETGVRVWPA